jgi:hypothetical protein
MRNPFRFGARWSWLRIRVQPKAMDRTKEFVAVVTVKVRWWHPLAWIWVARHLRLRFERTA